MEHIKRGVFLIVDIFRKHLLKKMFEFLSEAADEHPKGRETLKNKRFVL